MNALKSSGFLLICMLLTACPRHGGQDIIRIENDCFVKSFQCNSSKADIIRPIYLSKEDERILNHAGAAYFEFVINEQLVTSEDRLWVFKDLEEDPLGNGGSEYTLEFEGARGVVKGLGLTIKQQVFPASSLVREQLTLHSREEEFMLNKKEGELHFIFPGYSLRMKDWEKPESAEIRIASWENRPPDFDPRKSGNHMYYPEINTCVPGDSILLVKGPFHLLSTDSLSWLTAYEHASQDHTGGLLDEKKTGRGKLINDAMQGTKGVFNFPLKNEDFLFLGITAQKESDQMTISVEAKRGAYLDGEIINTEHPYESVWTATAFYEQKSLDKGKEIIREYLFNQICENPVSRTPEFYYNTWGLQRADPSKPLRGILTYDRIFEEIEYAAQMGVDIFVLDDGWEQAMGIWTPHKERLPEGLKPIKEKLDEHGIKMGLWFSPMGIDSTSSRYREHPEWVIRDSEGNPIQAQWGHPAFDFVGGFSDLFVEDCKAMIDLGCRFMKWDAINTFYSSLPGLHHGSETDTPEERRARYEYLLPIYVVKAMEILTEYEPELVIEIDLTEARRVMIGLAPLSQGKLFFMNNGASWYNDYSSYRTKSMRTIANEYAGIIPLELFTYASYPHNMAGSMEYNVSSSLLAGHGFWGNLSLMSWEELDYVGQQVEKSKRILSDISQSLPMVQGEVGDSPEIYRVINEEESAGQIIAFSGAKATCRIEQPVNPAGMLAVLDQPYQIKDENLVMELKFPEGESGKAIFILPNEGADISIRSSSVALRDAGIKRKELTFETQGAGEQVIIWPFNLGEPKVKGNALTQVKINREGKIYRIYTEVSRQGVVEICGEQLSLLDDLKSPVLIESGRFHMFFTLVEIEPDSMIYSYLATSTSQDLKEWTPVQKLSPKDKYGCFYKQNGVSMFYSTDLKDWTDYGNTRAGDFDRNSSIGIAWSEDLEQWSWPL